MTLVDMLLLLVALLLVLSVLAWCLVTLPLAVLVGRSLRRSSEFCGPVVESLAR